MRDDYLRALRVATHYRGLGLCPLPSRMEGFKGPLMSSYTEHYGPKPVSESVYEDWATTNIQIITGVKSPTPTKVIVVDLDGPEAIEAWSKITKHHGYVANRGWVSVTGSGGRHLWFLLPDGTEGCPSGIIWGLYDTWGQTGKGDWCKHKEIRILADNALAVAPPSIHVETGRPYKFIPPDPNVYRLPEVAPDWLLAMPRLQSPRFVEPPKPRVPMSHKRNSQDYYTREEVLDALGIRKWDIAVNEWRLVPACSGPNPAGWCACYVPGREDPNYSRPSGSLNYGDGTFQDRKDNKSISFFDLSVLLGVYQTWQECRDALGDRFIGKRSVKPQYSYRY